MAKMSDDELVAQIEAEEAEAYGWLSGELANDRTDAIDRFNAKPYGNEVAGRSSVVSSDVRDTVEALMPSVARVFLSGDEIGKFEPISPEDVGYEVESEICNWYLMTRNDGFNQLYAAFKDALLQGNGYVKAWWETKQDIRVERYAGLSDEEAAILLEDDDVEVVEHTAYPDPLEDAGEPEPVDADEMMPEAAPMPGQGMTPPMVPGMGQPPEVPRTLHDIKVERKKPEEYVAICAVSPDELLVSRRHRDVSLANADFVQHRRRISIGELRALGYDAPDDLPTDDTLSTEELARSRYQEYTADDISSSDPTRKIVTLRESWYRGDVSGTGQQELWRVCTVGHRILHKEEAEFIPIASFAPSYYPHSHIGISLYSLISDVAAIKTSLLRQFLDNLYLANNTQTVVDATRVNLDDWLISRPGGIKRINGPIGDAFAQLATPDVGAAALNGLEYIDAVKENRTGVARVNQGSMDPNALNRTATGASLMMSAGQSRQELICRCLAGGVKDLFLLTHALALKHSTRPMQIRLHNKWVTVNPREWQRRTDFALNVALGTGAPEQQMAKLQQMFPFMQAGTQLGLVTPENWYQWGKEYLRVAGYRSPDKFLSQPQPGAQPPQQPNPLVQAEQVKLQGKQMELQHKAQTDAQQMQMKAALDKEATANQMAQEQRAAQMEYELAQQKMKNEMEIELFKARLAQETAIRLKEMELTVQRERNTLDVYRQPVAQ